VVAPEDHSRSVRSGSRESCNDEKTATPEPVNPLAEYEAELSRARTAKATGVKPDPVSDAINEAVESLMPKPDRASASRQ
jgi:hypothetical protein